MKFNNLRNLPLRTTASVVTVATFAGILLGNKLAQSNTSNNIRDLPTLTQKEHKHPAVPTSKPEKTIDLVSIVFAKSYAITGDFAVIFNGSVSRGEDPQEVKTSLTNFQRLQDLGLIPKDALEIYKQQKMLGSLNAADIPGYEEAVSAWYNITDAINTKKITLNDVNQILKDSNAKDLLLNGIPEVPDKISDFTSYPLSVGGKAWLAQIQSEHLNKLLTKLAEDPANQTLKDNFINQNRAHPELHATLKRLDLNIRKFEEYNQLIDSMGLSRKLGNDYLAGDVGKRDSMILAAKQGIELDQAVRDSMNKQLSNGTLELPPHILRNLPLTPDLKPFIPPIYNLQTNEPNMGSVINTSELFEFVARKEIELNLNPDQQRRFNAFSKVLLK